MIKRSVLVGVISLIGLLQAGCDSDVRLSCERARLAWRQVLSLNLERSHQVDSLVEVMRERLPAERELLDEVAAARDGILAVMADGGSIADGQRCRTCVRAELRPSAATARLYEMIKRYPRVTTDSRLMGQVRALQQLEDRIIIAQSDFNSALIQCVQCGTAMNF
ncbi:LemA family protein [Microvirga lotononidis]|uniref:LemA family protein n=1 Tax=Microvirga lotononidis TaxID=864069 RepID=UPI00058DBC56